MRNRSPRPSGLKPRPRPAKPARAERPSTDSADASQRLQKVMAAAGVGSRRDCEALILAGRVEVDQKVVRELGTKVDSDEQEIRVDGVALKAARKAYYLVNKPTGVLCTNDDPSGRPRVVDLLPDASERLFTVGRLDLNSEGLILVTNDGELANRLAHPRYGVEKTYHVLVAGTPEPEMLAKLRKGVHLAEGFAKVESVRVKTSLKKSTILEIVLKEGRNREIRRLLARVGHKVLRLKRVALGGLRLKNLAAGDFRRLTREELRDLRDASRPRRERPAKPEGAETPMPAEGERKNPPAKPAAAQRPQRPRRAGHGGRRAKFGSKSKGRRR